MSSSEDPLHLTVDAKQSGQVETPAKGMDKEAKNTTAKDKEFRTQ